MSINKMVLCLLPTAILVTSCATTETKDTHTGVTTTSKTAQKAIENLDLEYVEDGTNSNIAYD